MKQGKKIKEAWNLNLTEPFTSVLKRATKTCHHCVRGNPINFWVAKKVLKNMALGMKRHYGALQGLNKKRQLDNRRRNKSQLWRRSL